MADVNDFMNAVGSSFGDFSLTVTDNGQLSVGVVGGDLISADFCVTFAGREAFTLHLLARSPEEAAETANAMVRLANRSMPGWSLFVGMCPSGV
jgi:hypothetical protein